jgi:hypothetical protein
MPGCMENTGVQGQMERFVLSCRQADNAFVCSPTAQASSPINDTLRDWIFRVFVAMRPDPDALNEGRILRLVNRYPLYRR